MGRRCPLRRCPGPCQAPVSEGAGERELSDTDRRSRRRREILQMRPGVKTPQSHPPEADGNGTHPALESPGFMLVRTLTLVSAIACLGGPLMALASPTPSLLLGPSAAFLGLAGLGVLTLRSENHRHAARGDAYRRMAAGQRTARLQSARSLPDRSESDGSLGATTRYAQARADGVCSRLRNAQPGRTVAPRVEPRGLERMSQLA